MDTELRIRLYDPRQQQRAPRIKEEQWQMYKSRLEEMHVWHYTRAQMRDWLVSCGFSPSAKQLNERMTAWGFRRYGSQSAIAVFHENAVLPDMSLHLPSLNVQHEVMDNQAAGQGTTDDNNSVDVVTSPHPETPLQLEENYFECNQFDRNIPVVTEDRLEGPGDGQAGAIMRWNDDELDKDELYDIVRMVEKRTQHQHDMWTPLHTRGSESSDVVDVDQITASKPSPKSISNETRSSWSFYRVTGFPKGGASIITESVNESIAEVPQAEGHNGLD